VPQKAIVWFGRDCTLACDGRCDKAWGINGRPSHAFSDDPDDYVYLADGELGNAPGPGETAICSEGGHMKPSATIVTNGKAMNKWCSRECERSTIAEVGDRLRLPDFSRPRPNMPHRRTTDCRARRSAEGGCVDDEA